MAMHLTFEMSLAIEIFGYTCIAGLCSFLPSLFWEKLHSLQLTLRTRTSLPRSAGRGNTDNDINVESGAASGSGDDDDIQILFNPNNQFDRFLGGVCLTFLGLSYKQFGAVIGSKNVSKWEVFGDTKRLQSFDSIVYLLLNYTLPLSLCGFFLKGRFTMMIGNYIFEMLKRRSMRVRADRRINNDRYQGGDVDVQSREEDQRGGDEDEGSDKDEEGEYSRSSGYEEDKDGVISDTYDWFKSVRWIRYMKIRAIYRFVLNIFVLMTIVWAFSYCHADSVSFTYFPRLYNVGIGLRLEQQWKMFAPNAPIDQFLISIPAVLQNNTKIDIFKNRGMFNWQGSPLHSTSEFSFREDVGG